MNIVLVAVADTLTLMNTHIHILMSIIMIMNILTIIAMTADADMTMHTIMTVDADMITPMITTADVDMITDMTTTMKAVAAAVADMKCRMKMLLY